MTIDMHVSIYWLHNKKITHTRLGRPSSCLNISLPPGGSQWNWHYRQSVEVMIGFIASGADNSIG